MVLFLNYGTKFFWLDAYVVAFISSNEVLKGFIYNFDEWMEIENFMTVGYGS